MIFISTDILNPYKREIISRDSYKTLIDFLQDKYPNGFERPTDVSINGTEIAIDDYDIKLNEIDVIVLLDRAALPVGLIGGWFITALANLAISVTLSYVANKLFAPDAPETQAQPSSVYNLNSAQNMARFGSPIPIIYGKVRMFPSMIVQPYYKFEDNVEYLYHVLCVGQGTNTTDDVLIGDDSITSTGDLDWKLLYQDSFYNIPLNGLGVHITKTLSNPSNMELKINEASEKYIIKKDAEILEIDYMYPNGLILYEGDGEDTSARTSFDINIYTFDGTFYTLEFSEPIYINARDINPIQTTYRKDISSYAEDIYVSFEKTLGEATDKRITNTYIKRVKEIYPNEDFTQLYGDITLLTCKIKATNAISSAGQIKVNGYFERIDVGNTIAEVLTDLYTNTSYGGGLSADDLSFPVTTETVDCAYDSNMTIFDAMRKPALAQGYSLYLAGMDVILKKDGVNTQTSGMYNEMNILRNSLKVQYLFKEEYPAYDGFECTYIEGCGWTQKTETYPSSSTRPQRVDLFGVVDWQCAFLESHVFAMVVTSPVEVGFTVTGGTITNEDNGDGTWNIWSDDNISSIVFNTNKASVTSIVIYSSATITDGGNMFSGCSAATVIDVGNLDTSNMTDMESMFFNCGSVTSLDLSRFDTSKVEDMSYMFYGCVLATSIDVSGFDTALVTTMSNMFNLCLVVTDLDVSSFHTPALATMTRMFQSANSITSLDLQLFDFSSVIGFTSLFQNASNLICLTNLDTSNSIGSSSMFSGCSSMVQPDSASQILLSTIPGTSWVNPGSCP